MTDNLDFIGEKVQFPYEGKIGRGLENAITNNTLVGYVDGMNGKLYYRGIAIEELAHKSSYEEVTYLLLYGKLPTKNQLDQFTQKMKDYREIPSEVENNLRNLPDNTHPMHMLSIGMLNLAPYDKKIDDLTIESETEISVKIISQMATVTGVIARIKAKKPVIKPDNSLSHAANFLYLLTGEKEENDSFGTNAMNTSMILHADHGMNASTFGGMVVHSGLSCMYSTVVGSIGTLKGHLHGGANERAVQALLEIRDLGGVDKVEEWYSKKRQKKEVIFGFGHRVYKSYDPRARELRNYVTGYCTDDDEVIGLCEIAERLEEVVIEDLGKTKKIFPNIDLYSGLLYMYMGIKPYMFTPVFAASRAAGWTARVIEYMEDNRIFRPRAHYYGPIDVKYVPVDDR
ncbi:MAG: citrate/2-methylcitrate synthase [Candidatus Odinarchaeota archaeon]